MDGTEGKRHPILGARIARWLFGSSYGELVLLHSRHYAGQFDVEPSKLCWADKMSHLYYPTWLYLFLARLSGELKEYRQTAADSGFIPLSEPDEVWWAWLQDRSIKLAVKKRGDAVPYTNRVKCSG